MRDPRVSDSKTLLESMLHRRLQGRAAEWLDEAVTEIEDGVSDTRFTSLIALASRFAPRRRLEPDPTEISRAWQWLPGWSPERWTTLESVRVRLILARPDLRDSAFAKALEECFRYADEGELCALHRALAHLPRGERFLWRAGEGCRSNMASVFEAVACDTPYPGRFFDDAAWRQLVIKAVFIDAPLWRVYGLDERLSPELARMALDLADERRSAGREVQPQLCLCLGTHGGSRGLAFLEQQLCAPKPVSRRAAALGLARAGDRERLRDFLRREAVPEVTRTVREALDESCDQWSFRALDQRSP
jgi:hypothetical protein